MSPIFVMSCFLSEVTTYTNTAWIAAQVSCTVHDLTRGMSCHLASSLIWIILSYNMEFESGVMSHHRMDKFPHYSEKLRLLMHQGLLLWH